MTARILLLDIETSPNKVYSWGLFKQNIALNQIEEPGSTLCWAAKWYGDKEVMFSSVHHNSKEEMVERVYKLIDDADAVVHYNGTKFDIPTLNQEFVSLGMWPPSPVSQIDLLSTVRKRFRLTSNKLDYVARYLGLAGKLKHKGMDLWRDCMAGDEDAWRTMKAYNIQDVKLLEQVYDAIKPWIIGHPNLALFTKADVPVCPNCGGMHLQKRGTYYTQTLAYQRYQCQECGTWSRARTTSLEKDKRANVLRKAV